MNFENFNKEIEKAKKVIAIDFDGVIHNDSKGFHDGTIYGDPISGVENALDKLSKSYIILIYSCKSTPDRPLVDGKNGTELLWEWFEKWKMKKYITDIVWGKPQALFYIDDKALRFYDWDQTLNDIDLINKNNKINKH